MTTPMLDRKDIAAFYDNFVKRSFADYVFGNPRVSAAIDRCCSVIGPDVTRVLDIGCGIGFSSFEFYRRNPRVSVLGVDISPERIAVARKLFACSRVAFEISDTRDLPREAPYDLITLIDVYEHVPRAAWPAFNRVVADSLSDNGILVLTTPTPFHQAYLAKSNPGSLQVVDETVELNDIAQLTQDVSGTLICYEMVSIWNTNDYLHVIVSRHPKYERIERHKPRYWQRAMEQLRRVGGTRRRRGLLQAKLGVRV